MMDSNWRWILLSLGVLAGLILLLYFRTRRYIKRRHNHIALKIDAVHQKVATVQTAVEEGRREAHHATLGARESAGYLTAMAEGARKDANAAAEGIRTAQHASDAAAALREAKVRDSLKEFQAKIWRQFAEFLKSKFGRNHDPPPDEPLP